MFHCMYIHHIFFIHLSVDGHLGCFHVLGIVNSAAMNIRVHVSFWIIVLSGYMPRNGIAGSYGNSIFSYVILLNVVPCPLPSCLIKRFGWDFYSRCLQRWKCLWVWSLDHVPQNHQWLSLKCRFLVSFPKTGEPEPLKVLPRESASVSGIVLAWL